MSRLLKRKFNFLKEIYNIKSLGFPILAIGAAAKGNTFLKYLNLDSDVIEYITDVSEHKKGKNTPLTCITICDDGVFKNYNKIYAIILSWNLSEDIKQKLYKINPNIEFLIFDDF